jgi:hypothetical protein
MGRGCPPGRVRGDFGSKSFQFHSEDEDEHVDEEEEYHEQDPLTPAPLPTREIHSATEAWGEGAPLTAQGKFTAQGGFIAQSGFIAQGVVNVHGDCPAPRQPVDALVRMFCAPRIRLERSPEVRQSSATRRRESSSGRSVSSWGAQVIGSRIR